MQQSIQTSTADFARLSELIGAIYDAALEPGHWNRVLPEIASWINARLGLLYTPLHTPEAGGYYFNHGIPESVMHLWATKWHNQDELINIAVQRGLIVDGTALRGEDVLPFEQICATPIYQQLNRPHGIDHILASVVFGLGSPSVIPTLLNLYRSIDQGPFTEEERDRLLILLPHVSRSFGVMARLKCADMKIASSHAALDRLTHGVLLLNKHGQIEFFNLAARRILEEEDGISVNYPSFASPHAELRVEDARAQAALGCAINNAISLDIYSTEHFSSAVVVPRPSGRHAYMLNFSTLPPVNEFGCGVDSACAIVFITDSAEPIKLNADLFRKTYGLTPAEIRVTELVAECLTVEEVAERLGLSRDTVKSHLQHVYAKTGTNNRAKLMRLVMSLASIR